MHVFNYSEFQTFFLGAKAWPQHCLSLGWFYDQSVRNCVHVYNMNTRRRFALNGSIDDFRQDILGKGNLIHRGCIE
jgi:hypothetical protein